MEKFFRKLLVDWSGTLTWIFLILAIAGIYVSKDIELKLSLTDLLPQDHPTVVKFFKLSEIVGGVGYVEILLHAEDGKSHLELAPELVSLLRENKSVRSAFFHREEYFFMSRALYYAGLDKLRDLDKHVQDSIQSTKRKFFDIGLWENEEETKQKEIDPEFKKVANKMAALSPYLLSKDGKDLVVMVKPNFDSMDMGKSKELVHFTEETLKKKVPQNISYTISGRYFSKVRDSAVIEKDIYVLGIFSNLVIALVLFLYFRSLRSVISIFTPVILGLGFTALVTRYTIGHLNLITGFLVGMLAGVGADYGIHLLWRIRLEQREPSSSDPDPLWRTLLTCGWANFVILISTGLCLFLMCGSSFRVFSEFGFIGGVGLCSILMTKMGSFYCTSKLLKLEDIMQTKTFPFQNVELPILKSTKAYFIGLFLTLLLAGMAVKVGFEFDFDKMMEHSEEVRKAERLIDVIYDRSTVPSAFAANSKEESIAIENYLKEKYSKNIVQSIVNSGSIVPEDQNEKEKIIQSIHKRIERISDKRLEESSGMPSKSIRTWVSAKPFIWSDLPVYIQEALRGTKQAGYLIYIYPNESLNNGDAVARWAAMIKDVEGKFPNIISGSDAVIFSEILDLIKRDGLILLVLIILFVGIFIWMNLRDLKHTLLSYVSFLISLPTGIGLMVIFGVKFNIFNVALLPVFIAAGIEAPIQLMQRADEIKSGFKGVRDIAVSLQLSLLAATIGFGILIFTRAGVLRSMGWMSIMILGAGWWVGLFLHPALLERYFEWEKKRNIKS